MKTCPPLIVLLGAGALLSGCVEDEEYYGHTHHRSRAYVGVYDSRPYYDEPVIVERPVCYYEGLPYYYVDGRYYYVRSGRRYYVDRLPRESYRDRDRWDDDRYRRDDRARINSEQRRENEVAVNSYRYQQKKQQAENEEKIREYRLQAAYNSKQNRQQLDYKKKQWEYQQKQQHLANEAAIAKWRAEHGYPPDKHKKKKKDDD